MRYFLVALFFMLSSICYGDKKFRFNFKVEHQNKIVIEEPTIFLIVKNDTIEMRSLDSSTYIVSFSDTIPAKEKASVLIRTKDQAYELLLDYKPFNRHDVFDIAFFEGPEGTMKETKKHLFYKTVKYLPTYQIRYHGSPMGTVGALKIYKTLR